MAEMNEQTAESIKYIDTLIVHNGLYHADDVLVAAMIRQAVPDVKIIRTRDPEVLRQGQENIHTLVADVGVSCKFITQESVCTAIKEVQLMST